MFRKFVVDRLPRQIFHHYREQGALANIEGASFSTQEDGSGIVDVYFTADVDQWEWQYDANVGGSVWVKVAAAVPLTEPEEATVELEPA